MRLLVAAWTLTILLSIAMGACAGSLVHPPVCLVSTAPTLDQLVYCYQQNCTAIMALRGEDVAQCRLP